MAFSDSEVQDLLVRCHRRCCVCHKYCGVKIEIDHIKPRADGGSDDISNAIPVCFECHAEIHLYNPEHPKGRRFTPDELRHHRDQWLEICRLRPDILVGLSHWPNPGAVERLLHELEFNEQVASLLGANELGCPFETGQFASAIADGTFSWLPDEVRKVLQDAYIKSKRANTLIALIATREHPYYREQDEGKAKGAVRDAQNCIHSALELIRNLLKPDKI